MKGVAFMEGKYLPLENAGVSILDLGLIHSDATYDVVHVTHGRFFRLDWHLERFARSAKGFRLRIPYSNKKMQRILSTCVKKAGLRDALVWMVLTRGIPESGNPRDLRNCKPRFIAYAKPYYAIKKKSAQAAASMLISRTQRIPEESLDPTMKNFHWADLTRAQFEAMDAGLDTAVLLDSRGNITEGPGFNVCMVKNGVFMTPESGTLRGVTQRSLLALCKELKIPAKMQAIPRKLFASADEICIASTSGGLTPVTLLKDGKVKRKISPGPISARLIELYWQKHTDKKWTTPV